MYDKKWDMKLKVTLPIEPIVYSTDVIVVKQNCEFRHGENIITLSVLLGSSHMVL